MNIEALVKKHIAPYSLSDNGGTANLIRNALTEQAEAFKGELQAYDGTVRELTKTVEDMRAAQAVPDGWRIDRCSDGSINVIKDGHGGANVEQNAKQARRIPEEVLWMLVNDMLSAAPERK